RPGVPGAGGAGDGVGVLAAEPDAAVGRLRAPDAAGALQAAQGRLRDRGHVRRGGGNEPRMTRITRIKTELFLLYPCYPCHPWFIWQPATCPRLAGASPAPP